MDLLQLLMHPLTALVLCVLFGAIAMSGKFSRHAATIMLIIAGLIGAFGIARSGEKREVYLIPEELLFVAVVILIGVWLRQPTKATHNNGPKPVASATVLPIPDLSGAILRAFRDEEQKCYYLEVGLTNKSEVSCTVAKYILNVSGGDAAFGQTKLRGTMEEYTQIGQYSISRLPFLVQPLNPDDKHPLQRGIEQIGWVEFYVENTHPLPSQADTWEDKFALSIIDSLAHRHTLPEVLITVRRARFHRGLKEDLDNLQLL